MPALRSIPPLSLARQLWLPAGDNDTGNQSPQVRTPSPRFFSRSTNWSPSTKSIGDAPSRVASFTASFVKLPVVISNPLAARPAINAIVPTLTLSMRFLSTAAGESTASQVCRAICGSGSRGGYQHHAVTPAIHLRDCRVFLCNPPLHDGQHCTGLPHPHRPRSEAEAIA
jgi:hypothetical protein